MERSCKDVLLALLWYMYELSEELIDISQRARNKKLKPKEMTGGTFTISSLGGVGGKFFTPIINPPEVEMPGPAKSWGKLLQDEVDKNSVLTEEINDKVKRILNVAAFTKRFSNLLSDLSTFQEK